jgi:hypothetical protein
MVMKRIKMILSLVLKGQHQLNGAIGTAVEIAFLWSPMVKKYIFTAPVDGTKQLFEVNFPGLTQKNASTVRQITSGDFDVTRFGGVFGDTIVL